MRAPSTPAIPAPLARCEVAEATTPAAPARAKVAETPAPCARAGDVVLTMGRRRRCRRDRARERQGEKESSVCLPATCSPPRYSARPPRRSNRDLHVVCRPRHLAPSAPPRSQGRTPVCFPQHRRGSDQWRGAARHRRKLRIAAPQGTPTWC